MISQPRGLLNIVCLILPEGQWLGSSRMSPVRHAEHNHDSGPCVWTKP